MRQLRPANGTVWRTGTAGKQAQLGPARELRGSIEHRGTSSASSAFCTNSRPLWAPAPPGKKHSLRREALSSHLSPAQRKEIFNGWSGGPFQVQCIPAAHLWCPYDNSQKRNCIQPIKTNNPHMCYWQYLPLFCLTSGPRPVVARTHVHDRQSACVGSRRVTGSRRRL